MMECVSEGIATLRVIPRSNSSRPCTKSDSFFELPLGPLIDSRSADWQYSTNDSASVPQFNWTPKTDRIDSRDVFIVIDMNWPHECLGFSCDLWACWRNLLSKPGCKRPPWTFDKFKPGWWQFDRDRRVRNSRHAMLSVDRHKLTIQFSALPNMRPLRAKLSGNSTAACYIAVGIPRHGFCSTPAIAAYFFRIHIYITD